MVTVDNKLISNIISMNTNYRINLHRLVYNNIENINTLVDLISQNNNFSVISCDPVQKIIILKIKKSTVKKDSNYSNDVYFYQTIIDNIMNCFIKSLNVISIPEESIRYMYDAILIADSSIVLYL